MLLSLLGSSIGFVISTNTTRNSILDTQLQEDAHRLSDAFEHIKHNTFESVRKLARDRDLATALVKERVAPSINRALDMTDRVQPVRDRFFIDQIIVLDNEGQTRVNIAPSHLETITVHGDDLLPLCTDMTRDLVMYQGLPLLVACAPITADSITGREDDIVGTVYSILDIEAWLERTRRNLELRAELELAVQSIGSSAQEGTSDQPPDRRNVQESISNDHREYFTQLSMEDEAIPVTLRVNTHDINEILESGLRVMLISSGLTLLLLLAVGLRLARDFTRPILKLARVANAMADGDLSHRANLTHYDEIGQLGRAVDHANVTISHLLHEQARASGERQAILQSIADGLLAIDTEGRIIMVNATAADILGLHAETIAGQPIDVIQETDDPALTDGLQQIVEQIRSELVDPDMAATEKQVALGSRIVRISSNPTLMNGGTRTGAVVVLQDITRVVEADRAKSEFIATASHELRTPLTSLKGFVDVFSMTGVDNLNENQHMFLDTIKRQTESIVQMVNDLLEMARLEQGTQRAERRWVRPNSAIDDALTGLNGLIEQREVTIETRLSPELPPIWIDYLHLRRILTNLISNAIKYVHRGGHVRISVYEVDNLEQLPSAPIALPWKHREERSLVIAVEDNGVGIRASDQPKIFTRFFRSENPLSVEVGGTGLGLAVTRSLVELHEGQIGFWSIENEGSLFWIRLPTPSTDPVPAENGHEHRLLDHSAMNANAMENRYEP